MAQNRVAEAGVSVTSNTVAREIKAINLRAETIRSRGHLCYTRDRVGFYPFRCGSSSLNAADDDVRISS